MNESPSIIPFAKSSRGETISDYVKECIINGLWKPGERIDDQELAKKIGVSRLTVREALSRLVENRVLTQVHWRGFYVRTLSWEEIVSIVEMREMLEVLALEKFMENADDRLLKELEKSISTSAKDLESDDRDGFFSSDFRFHEVLYMNSGNEWVIHFSKQIMFFIDLLRLMDKKRNFQQIAESSIVEHTALYEVICSGNLNKAVEMMREHITRFLERLKKTYETTAQ